jgi:hypothetical protein
MKLSETQNQFTGTAFEEASFPPPLNTKPQPTLETHQRPHE